MDDETFAEVLAVVLISKGVEPDKEAVEDYLNNLTPFIMEVMNEPRRN